MSFLETLNPEQKLAVTTLNGPVMVFAGAGSGKTRVITSRIVYALQTKFCNPYEILAITFTNKAAKEMRERVAKLLKQNIDDMYIATFHAFSLELLKQEIKYLSNYSSNFLIYDTNDQKQLLKNIIKEEFEEYDLNVDVIKSLISNLKAQNFLPWDTKKPTFNDPLLYKIYESYQKKLISYNAMDFDDILVNAYRLLKDNEKVLEKWSKKFKLILVDEYQDTSVLQFHLIKLLASYHNNIMAVGDDDQSIYSWRGANKENIDIFINSFPNTKVIKLEQNYRSTQQILNVANTIIANNKFRAPKKLWSTKKGEKIEVKAFATNDEEASFVMEKIRKLVLFEKKYQYKDIVILYRSNFQSRIYEETARMYNVPYKLIGGIKFYDRKEIQLSLAYLKILINNNEQLSFIKTLETPKRSIGDKTIEKIIKYANLLNISFYDALKSHRNIANIGNTAHEAIDKFVEIKEWAQKLFKLEENWQESLMNYLEKMGVIQYYKETAKNEKEFNKSYDYINEFARSLEIYKQKELSKNKIPSIKGFIDRIALLSEADAINNKDMITLMTIHTSKGLEYPVVFLVGLVDGTMPNKKSIEEDEQNLEEERRLMYVAITRAKEKLFMTYYLKKNYRGNIQELKPSPFLDEIIDNTQDIIWDTFVLDDSTNNNNSLDDIVDLFLDKFK